MAEQGCLLSSYTGKTGVGGSNPPLSARHFSAIIPRTQQVFGCGPGACSVKVCLNVGSITNRARGIQDWQGFEGSANRMKANESQSDLCQS